MRQVHCAIMAAALFSIMFQVSTLSTASAQTQEWQWGSLAAQSDDAVVVTNVEHTAGVMVKRANIPYVAIEYNGQNIYMEKLDLDISKLHSLVETDPTFGHTKWEGTYYQGLNSLCSPAQWKKIFNCYKMVATFEFLDEDVPTAGAPAKFKTVLKTSGTRFHSDDGFPEYEVRHRVDLDIPLGGVLDYIREKDGCTTWTTIPLETIYTNGCSGQILREHDTDIGWSQSVGLDPQND
ncbi:MAG: hypothetical protein MN733_16605, partial [Nitrososphaera sp.]|nr:hypothetical protein [Nitrososphaera sp.]